LTYIEHPVKILDEKERVTRNSVVKFYKVQWQNHSKDEATWEQGSYILKHYPTFSDEDITPFADPPTVMQVPMTRARMRQLNLEVSSFLSDSFYTFENRLLPNDVIFLRNIGEGHEGLRGLGGGEDDQQGHPTGTGGPAQHDFESALASRTSLP
jgi:hypothetical protein